MSIITHSPARERDHVSPTSVALVAPRLTVSGVDVFDLLDMLGVDPYDEDLDVFDVLDELGVTLDDEASTR